MILVMFPSCQPPNPRTHDTQGAWHDDKPSGLGALTTARPQLTYRGEFVDGRPRVVPDKLNAFYLEDPALQVAAAPAPGKKGTGAAPAAAVAGASKGVGGGKGGGKEDATAAAGRLSTPDEDSSALPQQGWVQLEAAAVLAVAAGQPLAVGLVVAAQRAEGIPASEATGSRAPSAGSPAASAPLAPAGGEAGSGCSPPRTPQQPKRQPVATASSSSVSAPSSGGAAAVPEPPQEAPARPMYFELPSPPTSNRWRTADTEFGRPVLLTLQRAPPQPLAPGRSLSVLLSCRPGGAADDEAGAARQPVVVELHICFDCQMGRAEALDAIRPPQAEETAAAAAAAAPSAAIAAASAPMAAKVPSGGCAPPAAALKAGGQAKAQQATPPTKAPAGAAGASAQPLKPLPPPVGASWERVSCKHLVLSEGVFSLGRLTLGAALPSCVPTGACWLVLSSPGVRRGVVPLVIGAPAISELTPGSTGGTAGSGPRG